MGSIGKLLILFGVLLVVFGLIVLFAERFPGLRIGKLPGDISIDRGNFRFYFPIATSLIVSLVLSLLLWLFTRR